MFRTILRGMLTGLMLQFAIGPVFFYILNISFQASFMHALIAIVAVTLVDYLYIILSLKGVGKVVERPHWKFFFRAS